MTQTPSEHPAKHEGDHVPTPAELVDDVLTEISKHLRSLASWMPLVREIADTHRDGLDYIPQSTRDAIGAQHTAARTGAQAAYATDARGTRSAAPGNMDSWALEADVEMTLRHLLKFVLRHHGITDHRGRVIRPQDAEQVPGQESTEQFIGRVRRVFMTITDLRIATAVVVDLEMLTGTCSRVLFGEDRTDLPSPCPYCGQRTLVVYLQTGVIRCERQRTDRPTACHCRGRHDVHEHQCPCTTQARFEHHWLRDRTATHPHSWQSLHRALITHTEAP